jgi:hypothetical protein
VLCELLWVRLCVCVFVRTCAFCAVCVCVCVCVCMSMWSMRTVLTMAAIQYCVLWGTVVLCVVFIVCSAHTFFLPIAAVRACARCGGGGEIAHCCARSTKYTIWMRSTGACGARARARALHCTHARGVIVAASAVVRRFRAITLELISLPLLVSVYWNGLRWPPAEQLSAKVKDLDALYMFSACVDRANRMDAIHDVRVRALLLLLAPRRPSARALN